MLTAGTNLYVGGRFTEIAGIQARGLAKWDGQTWSEVGGGIQGLNSIVFALFMDGTNLYVGGSFDQAGSISATNVAKWNGQIWEPLAGGVRSVGSVIYISPSVNAFYKQDTNLFVSGTFATAGEVSSPNIARWDGSKWHDVGGGAFIPTTGIEPGEIIPSGRVLALSGDGTNIYVGGLFTTAGNTAATNISQWDGGGWHAIGNTSEGVSHSVFEGEILSGLIQKLIWRDNSLFAWGDFTHLNSLTITNIARWNGSAWDAPIVVEGSISGMIEDGSDLYIAGNFNRAAGIAATNLIVFRDGVWSPIHTTFLGWSGATTLSTFGGETFIGGYFGSVNGVSALNIAKFGPDGSKAVAPGDGNSMDGYSQSVATDGTNTFAAGAFDSAGEKEFAGIARLEGSEWITVPEPPFGGGWGIRRMAVIGTNLYVNGYFSTTNGITNLAQWNGNQWSAVGNPADQPANIRDQSLTVVGTNLFVLGDGPICKRWNGFNWITVLSESSAQPNPTEMIATDGTNLFFALQRGQSPDFYIKIARANADGSDYQELPGQVPISFVSALCIAGTNIWVSGIQGSGASNLGLYTWNGNGWTYWKLFEEPGYISSFARNGNNIIVGGSFNKIAGIEANSIAQWDGGKWSSFDGGLTGQGLPGAVYDIAVFGKRIVFAGQFDRAGNQSSGNFAIWHQAAPIRLEIPPNNTSHLNLFGDLGDHIEIQSADALGAWQKLSELKFTNSSHEVIDPRLNSAESRFYRARVLEP